MRLTNLIQLETENVSDIMKNIYKIWHLFSDADNEVANINHGYGY